MEEPLERLAAQAIELLSKRDSVCAKLDTPATVQRLLDWLGEAFGVGLPRASPNGARRRVSPGEREETQTAFQHAQAWLLAANPSRAKELLLEVLRSSAAAADERLRRATLIHLVAADAELNQFRSALAAALQAQAVLDRAPDAWEQGGLFHNLALLMLRQNEFARAAEMSTHASMEACRLRNADMMAICLQRAASAYRLCGADEYALTIAQLALNVAAHGNAFYEVAAKMELANCLVRTGAYDLAQRLCVEILDRPDLTDPELTCRVFILECTIHARRGELSSALLAAHRALDLAQQLNYLAHLETAQSELGLLYLRLNDPERARSHFRESIRTSKARGAHKVHFAPYLLIARCYRMLGRLAEAARSLDTLSRIYASTNSRGVVFCELEKATLCFERGDHESARALLVNAVAMMGAARATWARLAPEIFVALALAHARAGDKNGAREVLNMHDLAWPDGPVGENIAEYYLALAEISGKEREVLYAGAARLDDLRHSLPHSLPRRSIAFGGFEALISRLIKIELDSGNNEKAYLLSQSARARHLVGLLAHSELEPPSAVDPSLAAEERRLLGGLRSHIADLALVDDAYTEAVNQREFDCIARELSNTWAKMEMQAPAYVRMRRGAALSLPDLARLLDPDAHPPR